MSNMDASSPKSVEKVQDQTKQSEESGWWGYMGNAWNSIQQTAQDFTGLLNNFI